MSTKKSIRSDDEISNKLVFIFFATIVALGALMIVNRLMLRGNTFLVGMRLVQSLGIAGAVCAVGSAICLFAVKPRRPVFSFILKASLAVIAASAFILYTDFVFAIKALYVIISAVSVMFFIFYIYPREFFYHTVLCTASGVSLWALSHFSGETVSPLAIIIVSLSLFFVFAALLVTFISMKHGGQITLFSKKLEILPKTANYSLLFITAAIIIAAFTSAFLIYSPAFTYYLIFALLGYLVVLAIYFTTRII